MAVDGTWKLVVNTPMGSQESTLVITSSGGTLTGKETLLLTAFGAGASWGSTVLTWPDLTTETTPGNTAEAGEKQP